MDYNVHTQNRCEYQCCIIRLLSGWMSALNIQLGEISKRICAIEQSVSNNQTVLFQIYASLATNNPMSVAAEYPTTLSDRVLYSTIKVRFLDMINPNLVVLFKGKIQSSLPVYFRDRSGSINPDDGYQHIVTVGDINTPMIAQDVVNNYPYPALYVGDYIIINPTSQTITDFENGTLT